MDVLRVHLWGNPYQQSLTIMLNFPAALGPVNNAKWILSSNQVFILTFILLLQVCLHNSCHLPESIFVVFSVAEGSSGAAGSLHVCVGGIVAVTPCDSVLHPHLLQSSTEQLEQHPHQPHLCHCHL